MQLTNQKYLRNILHKFGFFTKKNLWQNFLINKWILDQILISAKIKKHDDVIEIWPWPWVLTQELIKTWANITALEIDEKAICILKYITWEAKNLKILNINALKFIPKKSWFILCANIPYYLTSPIIRYYLWWKNKPKRVVFLLQKEVAQKICEKKWHDSVLSLQVKIFWTPEIITFIPKDNFFPIPKVDSALLRIKIFNKPLIPEKNILLFWDIIHHLFSEKRKKIINTLSKYKKIWQKNAIELLKKSWIDPNSRPQTLKINDWKNLIKLFQTIKQ